MSTPRRLVIVESPAKARIIAGYLGEGYEVTSSVGHIRDLPNNAADVPDKYRGTAWAKTGVDVEHDFAPMYVISASKKPLVRELKAAMSGVDELLLATDEDREGEAIAWHLVQVLQPKVPYRRMVFHEITKDAIRQAAENTRELNTDLVDAQETRRIVDRLFGYEISPVLWRRVAPKLSAGRVQSVALRLIVERERERIKFRSATYCDIRGSFAPGPFAARLAKVDGQRIAGGKDFDDTGSLTSSDVLLLDEAAAETLTTALAGRPFTVTAVEQKPSTRRPAAPFMTSTLQQEAGRRLRWTAKRVMDVAQRLYEGGYITYMRTDSTTLSDQAISAARAQAQELYGADHVPASPRRYDRKVKNAQEAHEAIRPSGDRFRTPGQVSGSVGRDEFLLYELIWKRTLASQMADAKVATTTLRLGATAADGRSVEFTASGTVVVFPGFLAAYADVSDDGSAQQAESRLPRLAEGDAVTAAELVAEPHSTNPPPRYTEGSLTKRLEEMGIGRPSTFATIANTLIDRNYVWRRGSALVPAFLGMTVVRLLEDHFTELVDYSFTAQMEEVLDAIAAGDDSRLQALERFYRGDGGFDGLRTLIDKGGDDIDARALSTFPVADSDAVVRVGRYGPYLQRGEDERANFPDDLAPDEITAAKVDEIFAQPRGDRELGTDPDSGRPIVVKNGRFGPFVTEILSEDEAGKGKNKVKPRTASLFKDMDPTTVTLEEALRLLSLPREVGPDPRDGEPIYALNGRYGPYIKKGNDSRSLADEAQLFTVTVDEALALLAEPPRRRGQRAPSGPLKELGADPVSGNPIVVKDGRFGAYVTDGEYNATIPKGDNVDEITLERASDLLVERRAKGPAKKSRKKSSAKKATAKKSAAKKSTTKKSAAKKTTTRKTAAKKTTAAAASAAPAETGVS
ncbi:MAG: type I DNA topoisomerase [Candidatus Nanopelagicales bacterium]